MRKAFPLFIFIIVQMASAALLTLWIVWYVTSRSQIMELARRYGVDPTYQTSVLWLLQGIFLMVPVIGGATLIFTYWTKLKLLDGLRTSFTSSISHELLTPLATIRLYVETLAMRDMGEEKKKEFLSETLVEIERLSGLISKILMTSKIERRKAVYRMEEADLGGVVRDFLGGNPGLSSSASITLDIEPDCRCKLDREAFSMVLRNLLENSVKFSPGRADVSVVIRRRNSRILLEFSDKGEGIARGEIKKIFGMFYRPTSRRMGTGLGLFIVKNVVSALGGKVWVESDGPGKGASFKLLLPAVNGPAGGA